MPITQKYAFVCDQVRKEDNGKLLIIGMYTPGMVVPTLPTQLTSLTCFFALETDRPGGWDFKVRLTHLESGLKLAETSGGRIDAKAAGAILMPITFGNIEIRDQGTYTFELRIEDHSEPFLLELPVALAKKSGR